MISELAYYGSSAKLAVIKATLLGLTTTTILGKIPS